MSLIYISCQGVFSVGDSFYAEALQESIIETLMCMIHGTEEPELENIMH